MEPFSIEEKKEVRNFLIKLYGSQATWWDINKNVLQIIEKIIKSSADCGRYMDLVPRPLTVGSPIKWGTKQARKALIRYLKQSDEYYITCLKNSAYHLKPKMVMATSGV